jgi:hypothetical protein
MHAAPCQGAELAPGGHSKLKSIQPSMMSLCGKYPSFITNSDFLAGQQ